MVIKGKERGIIVRNWLGYEIMSLQYISYRRLDEIFGKNFCSSKSHFSSSISINFDILFDI